MAASDLVTLDTKPSIVMMLIYFANVGDDPLKSYIQWPILLLSKVYNIQITLNVACLFKI